MYELTHGSLFSGIGGIDLGFERAGIRTVWQVENNPFCQKVLEKHWSQTTRYSDIRKCSGSMANGDCNRRPSQATEKRYSKHGCLPAAQKKIRAGWNILEHVDIVSGGFPCQDVSNAGNRAGLSGSRSGLWAEMARVVGEVRPRYVVVENVSALLGRGIDRVLGQLAALGYDAEWDCIPALAIGAPHRRDRIFIVAIRSDEGAGRRQELQESCQSARDVADCIREHLKEQRSSVPERKEQPNLRRDGNLAYSLLRGWSPQAQEWTRLSNTSAGGQWSRDPADEDTSAQSYVGRVAHGVPCRVDRIKSLGNAVVPQVAEFVGRCLVEFDQRKGRSESQREICPRTGGVES